jgi:hypothetical protein
MLCLTPPVTGQTAISLVRLPLIVMDLAETPLDPREGRIPPVQVTVPPHPKGTVTLPQARATVPTTVDLARHTTADPVQHTTESVMDTTARYEPRRIDPTDMRAMCIIATMVMTGAGKSDIGLGSGGCLDIGLL